MEEDSNLFKPKYSMLNKRVWKMEQIFWGLRMLEPLQEERGAFEEKGK